MQHEKEMKRIERKREREREKKEENERVRDRKDRRQTERKGVTRGIWCSNRLVLTSTFVGFMTDAASLFPFQHIMQHLWLSPLFLFPFSAFFCLYFFWEVPYSSCIHPVFLCMRVCVCVCVCMCVFLSKDCFQSEYLMLQSLLLVNGILSGL